jgi:hypothetical protein
MPTLAATADERAALAEYRMTLTTRAGSVAESPK